MVGVVIATAEVEVEDIDGIDFLDDTVVLADAYLVGDGRGRSEQDALEEVALLRQLHLHDDVLTPHGLGLHVHAVSLVLTPVLIVLTLQYLGNRNRLTQEYGNQPLKHLLVRLVAKDALDGPVKPYVLSLVCRHHLNMHYNVRGKDTNKNPNCQANGRKKEICKDFLSNSQKNPIRRPSVS